MGIVTTGFSMSLDGFVAGPNDSLEKPLGRAVTGSSDGTQLIWPGKCRWART